MINASTLIVFQAGVCFENGAFTVGQEKADRWMLKQAEQKMKAKDEAVKILRSITSRQQANVTSTAPAAFSLAFSSVPRRSDVPPGSSSAIGRGHPLLSKPIYTPMCFVLEHQTRTDNLQGTASIRKEGKPKAIAVTLDNNLHLPGSVSRGIPFP